MFSISTHAADGATVSGHRRNPAALLLDAVLDWQERAQSRQALAHVDDRLLRDIGLTRSMVDAEISKPFWRS